MSGRITSREPSLNPFGVPYKRVLELKEQAYERLLRAYREALEAWEEADKTVKDSKEKQRRLREARRRTQIALS